MLKPTLSGLNTNTYTTMSTAPQPNVIDGNTSKLTLNTSDGSVSGSIIEQDQNTTYVDDQVFPGCTSNPNGSGGIPCTVHSWNDPLPGAIGIYLSGHRSKLSLNVTWNFPPTLYVGGAGGGGGQIAPPYHFSETGSDSKNDRPCLITGGYDFGSVPDAQLQALDTTQALSATLLGMDPVTLNYHQSATLSVPSSNSGSPHNLPPITVSVDDTITFQQIDPCAASTAGTSTQGVSIGLARDNRGQARGSATDMLNLIQRKAMPFLATLRPPDAHSANGRSAARPATLGVRDATPACIPLKITAPSTNNIIALTDPDFMDPQPGPNDRRPSSRTLKVTGTAPNNVSTVDINGVSAPVANNAWTAKIPVAQLGKLTLKASANGKEDSVHITLIDLKITSPAENAAVPLKNTPALPNVKGQVALDGFNGATTSIPFNWTLEARGQWVTSVKVGNHREPKWTEYTETVATGSTTGASASWNPQSGNLVGGVGRLIVTANVPGAHHNPVTSDPRWIDIPGANPSLATAQHYVDQHESTYASVVRHIFCWESAHHAWGQFATQANSNEPQTLNVPKDWTPNPASLRPSWGFPGGIGIAQVDPADFPDQQWDWQANERGGIAVYHQKLANVLGWPGRERQRLQDRRIKVLAAVNAARHAKNQPPLALPVIVVPDLTIKEKGRDAVRQYNGGHEYHFNADYIVAANGTDVTVLGDSQWADTPAGQWGGMTSVTQPRHWIPGNNQPYVNKVLGCTPS